MRMTLYGCLVAMMQQTTPTTNYNTTSMHAMHAVYRGQGSAAVCACILVYACAYYTVSCTLPVCDLRNSCVY